MKWRYSYGRKCYREKLQNVSLQLPATDDGKLDSSFPDRLLQQAHSTVTEIAQQSLDTLLFKFSSNRR